MRKLADRNTELELRLATMEARNHEQALVQERLAALEAVLLGGAPAMTGEQP